MDLLKKHVDTVIIISAIVGSMVWINTQFNEVNYKINEKFSVLEKDIAIIKTVLVMKNIMPSELAKTEQIEKK